MKIRKTALRHLIENYLFEEEEKSLQNSQAFTDGKGMKGEHLRTKDVKFSWGTYKGKHANKKYVILQGEKELGDFQKNGDPFTYKEMPNGKYKVISGPAQFDSSIGKVVTIKKKEKERPNIDIAGIVPGGFSADIMDDFKETIQRRDAAIRALENVSGTVNIKASGKGKDNKFKTFREDVTFNSEYIKNQTGQTSKHQPAYIAKEFYELKNGKYIKDYNDVFRDVQLINLIMFGDYLRSLKDFYSDLIENDIITTKNSKELAEISKDLYRVYYNHLLKDFCFGHEKNITPFWNQSFRRHTGASGAEQKGSILGATVSKIYNLIESLPKSKNEEELKERVEKLIKAIDFQYKRYIF